MNTLSAEHYRPVRRVMSVVIAAMIVVTAMACSPSGGSTTSRTKPGSSEEPQAQGAAVYDVFGPRTFADINAIAATGASVDAIEDGRVAISAAPSEVSALRRLGFRVELVHAPPAAPV